MKGDVELFFNYNEWGSVSEMLDSLKSLGDDLFLQKIYASSFDDSVRNSIPFEKPNIIYTWGKESLLITFDW